MLEIQIESLLFVSAKPLTIKKLAEFLEVNQKEVEVALEILKQRVNKEESGIRIVRTGNEVQMLTSPDSAKLTREFLKDEITGELTKPQLETLTVVAYCQPISKAELEQIRGVNCGLILRNLMIRGLIESEESKEKFGPVYKITHDFMKFLGISDISELPDYEKLKSSEHLKNMMAEISD